MTTNRHIRKSGLRTFLDAALLLTGIAGLLTALRSLPDARRYLRMRRM